MNGKISAKPASTSSVWPVASQWIHCTTQSEPWWTIVGPQLASLAHHAQYGIEEQFEVLLFLHAKVIPRVGTLYQRAKPDWPSRYASLLTDDGSPFEYSWKWNSASSSNTPEVRYCIEAIGPHTGTRDDPYNYIETEKLMVDGLAHSIPELDLTWFRHFAKALKFDAPKSIPSNPEAPPATMFVAFEHTVKAIVVKAYFIPSSDGDSAGPPTFGTFADAARGVIANTDALDAVMSYVKDDDVGSTLMADMLAIDCVDPTKSRLKVYASVPVASFASIVSVMTLGGKITNVDQGIQELWELLRLVLGLEKDVSPTEVLSVQDAFDEALAHPFDLYGRMTFYFDIASSSKLPDVKLYIPVIRYGKSDAAVAAGLGEYLRLRQRGQYHEGFLRAMGDIGARHGEGSSHRLQTYLAVAFQQDGSLTITSYVNPGIYHDSIKVEK